MNLSRRRVPLRSRFGSARNRGQTSRSLQEEQDTIDALNAEQAKLEADYQDADELPDEVDQRLGQIEAALMAFDDRQMIFDPAEFARAGVFASIDPEGRLTVTGVIRPEDDMPATDPDAGRSTDTSIGGREARAPAPRRWCRSRVARSRRTRMMTM